MLTYLMKNASRAVPRSELLPAVWGFENDSSTRVADDTVKRLRKSSITPGCPSKQSGVTALRCGNHADRQEDRGSLIAKRGAG